MGRGPSPGTRLQGCGHRIAWLDGTILPDDYAVGQRGRDGHDGVDLIRGAASYVDRILRGAKPGDLPVQFPTKYKMVVNLKTAKALGLIVPPSIMLRADEVIE